MGETHKTESNMQPIDVLASHPTYRNLNRSRVEEQQSRLAQTSERAGASPAPAAIEWAKPVRTQKNGDGYVLSSNGKWSIVRETSKDYGTRYGLFSRTRDFDGSCGWFKTLEEAQMKAQSIKRL